MESAIGLAKYLGALVFVLALILFLAHLVKRTGLTGAPQGNGKRLSVVERQTLDSRHQLYLIRRDDTEHLILVGNQTDLLIEGHIPPKTASDQAPASKQDGDALPSDALPSDALPSDILAADPRS